MGPCRSTNTTCGFFPSIDLDTIRRHLPKLSTGEVPDDVYYARVRLMPEWNFRTVPFDASGSAIGRETVLGTDSVPAGADRAPGRAAFYEIRGVRPAGFYLEQRGLCFLRLRDPKMEGRETEDWTVGVDFGTSNTCVAYASAIGRETGSRQSLTCSTFPVFTTSLLRVPNYSNVDNGVVNEGASAVLDFFTRFGDRDTLNPDGYFPSQMLTQQPRVSDEDRFQLSKRGRLLREPLPDRSQVPYPRAALPGVHARAGAAEARQALLAQARH